MRTHSKTVLVSVAALVAALAISAGSAGAAVIPVTSVTGHNGGNWPATLGHLTDMVNGLTPGTMNADHNPGMDTSADPSDPSTWTYSGGTWQQEWLSSSILDSTTSGNNKIGWVVLDLGSVTAGLDNMYLWNNTNTNTGEYTDTFNVYYSSGAGIDALPATPNSQSNTGDYDFSSGDWNLLNSTGALTLTQNKSRDKLPEGTVALGGISAQYIGIEILTAGSATVSRVGLAQVEITPEPATLALLGIGGLVALRRRRRA